MRGLLLTYLLLAASCSLDSSPRTPAAGSKSKDTPWQPPSAASANAAVRADAAAGPDAQAQDVTATTTGGRNSKDAGAADSGVVRAIDAGKPVSGAVGAPPPTDAGSHNKAPDAAKMGDAMMPVRVDAGSLSMKDAGMPGCKAGVYAGTFSGMLQAVGVPISMVTGAINANLTLDVFGTYLNVRDLRVVGADESGNTLTVTVSGDINCSTFQLENGVLSDGTYYMVTMRTELKFVGVAAGTYTTSPHALNGTWNVSAQGTALLGGDGTFTLTLSGQ